MSNRIAIFLLAGFTLALAGCSEQRSRVVNEPAAGSGSKGEKGDYKAMIERSRSRQQTQDTLLAMQGAISKFQIEIGRVPSNLVELVNRRYIQKIPELPAGQRFAYDHNLGLLQIANVRGADVLTPELPPAPPLTNRATLSPLTRP